MHCSRQRLVFKQLKKFVFKHHSAFSGRHVFTDLEQRFVGHRHMALLDVVQQVFQALGNACTLGFDGFFLRFGIERQEVAGCGGGHPLLNGKAHARLGFGGAFDSLGQPHQRAGIEQVGGGRKFGHRAVVPGSA